MSESHIQYEYRPLDQASQEIRLLKILPQVLGEELTLEIVHTPFSVPRKPALDTRLSRKEIQASLPWPCRVFETLEGRYLFWNGVEKTTQWAHPDPDFEEESLYDWPALLEPHPDFDPNYEALSYAWGNEDATIATKILSVSSTRSEDFQYVNVRPNLHSALENLRRHDIARVVWVDALCINQDDVEERSSEVKRMEKIYALAERVVVWLGPTESDGSSQRALDILETLGKQIEYSKDEYLFTSPASAPVPATGSLSAENISVTREAVRDYSFQTSLPFHDSDYLAIRQLLDRPWWDRLWIWQEIKLASCRSTVLCGPHSASWKHIRRSLLYLKWRYSKIQERPELPASILERSHNLAKDVPKRSLVQLLYHTRKAQFSMPHDRIFAILGLTARDIVSQIQVNYAIPIDQLLQDICLAIVKCTKNLDFLGHCEDQGDDEFQQTMPNKPSWVPNWLRSPRLVQLPNGYVCCNSSTIWTHNRNGKTLTVHAVFNGVVQYAAAPAPMEGALAPVFELWEEVVRSLSSEYARITWKEVLVDILGCGYMAEMWPHWSTVRFDQALAAYDRKEFSSFVHPSVRGRSLFTFGNGSVGLGPATAREGDIIAVMLGFRFPIILRPLDPSAPSTTTWKVIGCAYVPSLDHGEALLGPVPSEYKVHYGPDVNNALMLVFTHIKTGQVSYEDPRLGTVPEGWELGKTFSDTELKWYQNRSSAETLLEPRVTVEELRKRDVDVREITLV